MGLARLIADLANPAAYPDSNNVQAVEVRQTHISMVFLTENYVYKIKKPINLGFVDYSTLDRRHHFCEQELRLNQRLAPSVYLGVVPITKDATGRLRMEGQGEVAEWAVKMVRLPESASFRARLRRDELGPEVFEMLARRLAAFHESAQAGPLVSIFGRFDVVAGNALENLEQSNAQVGTTLGRIVFDRLRELTESTLDRLRPTIEARATRGVPRDGHGDLRLEHIYLFPDRMPPEDLIMIDGIEFNDRFRCGDPVADMAFPFMDLACEGRRDLARVFAEAYFRARSDEEGRELLPFYTAYRAAVRGKVEGMEASEREVPQASQAEALVQARAHWLLALQELEKPSRRPCLVMVGGLPGTGKSTLARGLAERARFVVIRSDLVRKELAGAGSKAGFEAGIYTLEWTVRTYAECLRRAEAHWFDGDRVLIDATFRTEASRRLFLDTAEKWGIPAQLFICRAGQEIIRGRLDRRNNDASDAGWTISQEVAARWEDFGALTRSSTREIPTGGSIDEALDAALEVLHELGIWSPVDHLEHDQPADARTGDHVAVELG